MTERELNERWETTANKILLGRKIVKIQWLTKEEANKGFGWYSRPVVLQLDDGTEIIPQRDDEGNDGGALLWINPTKTETIETYPGNKVQVTKSEILPVF